MKKLMTIMLVVILSCNFVLCAYADEPKKEDVFYDEGVGGDQTIYINGIEYSVVYNGGYVVSCGDSSVTLSDFQCLIQLQQVLKKGGSINSYKGAGQAVAAAIGAVLPAVSKWGGALCNALNAVGDTKIKGTVNTDKTSNNYGAVTYDSTAVKQIYDLLMKQYMESHGMSNFFAGQYHTDKVSELYNQAYNNAMRFFGLSESTSYSYMRAIVEAMNEQGYTYVFLTVDYGVDTQHLYFIDLDNYAYAAHGTRPGGWTGSDRYCTYFYDANFEQLNNYVAVVDLKEYAEQFDTSQNPLDYVSYEDYLFDKGRQMYNYSEDARPLWAYSSFDKMVQDVQGGATDYITSDFASGNIPSSITLSPDMLSQDWDKFTDELTDAITDALKGADSSEKQDKIDETFQRYLKKINSNIEDLNADNNKLTKKSNKLLDDILDKVKDINKDTNKYLKGIQKDYLKDIKSYCKDMKKSMSDILKNVKTIKHIEELNLLITALSDSDRDKALSDIKTDSKQVQSVLHRKFPTCVFNDAKQIFDLLSATPVAPVVTMRVGFESVGVSDVLTMDFHIFDDYIGQFRQLQELIYIFVLFRATRKMFVDGGDL